MNRTLLSVALCAAGFFGVVGSTGAQIAGSTTVGVVVEATQITAGWSVKKTILGKTVYNEKGDKIGKVDDLIIDPEKNVSYLIVGAGGFVGLGRHDVAIPIAKTQEQNGKLVMTGATKDSVKAMPQFTYAKDTGARDRFVAKAEDDIAKAKVEVADLQKKAGDSKTEAKAKLDREVSAVQADLKAAEDKLGEMKVAGAARWKEFEAGVSAAMLRMRKSLATAMG